MSVTALLAVLIVAVLAGLVLQLVALLRGRGDAALAARLEALRGDSDRIERALREEQRAGRGELAQSFEQFRGHVQQQLDAANVRQHERIEGVGKRMDQLAERTDRGMQQFADTLQQRLAALAEHNQQRLHEMRGTLDAQLKALQQDNAQQLEKMRATVDEKLQATLEARLGESFRLVSERLEAVQRGLGEMRELATGVGDLKRVLSNVKTRGILGEVQLGALLEQILTTDQYAANVATRPGSDARVEFAVRMPGERDGEPVWLPIDAKFPLEDYQRLQDAQERADPEAAAGAAQALERRVREEARRIRDKYVAPPHTTDFAILFLPTEGLFAEVLRRPGLFDALQRDLHVTVAGPTTLTAILTSLKAGFRTLAIEKRSSEVWLLLGAIKSEFDKFGTVLAKVKKKLEEAGNHIEATGVRTRAIQRKLRDVESLPGEQAQALLGDALAAPDDAEADDGDDSGIG